LSIIRTSIKKSPNLGIYLKPVGKYLLAPPTIKKSLERDLCSTLGLEIFKAQVYESEFLGVFLAGNNNALLVPGISSMREISELEKMDMRIEVLDSKITALGNAILANDYGALVHPKFTDEDVEFIKKALEVPVIRGKIGGIPVVGSLSVVTNKGGLVSPAASEEELRGMRKLFEVDIYTGTVNDGVKFVKLGLVACDHGVAVGSLTTPLELDVIMEAFKV